MPAVRSRKANSVAAQNDAFTTERQARVSTDVILTIKPLFATLLSKREKNYEFRSYKLREEVKRFWLYESSPSRAIRYIIETAAPKTPGELRDPSGVGNDAFDAGALTKYAYPVCAMYKLAQPLTRDALHARFGTKSPQGFCYAPHRLIEELPLDQMERLY
ncbi:hypothetical protein WOLCODRAFT_137485 [Wolfiporia cocos MD-104 SS10]|uniref:Uncharacterized protein n=1 Tax=Wolfiporia cocos (strain MD-104) TaxID=742152 RepID=A0A2H3JHC2_WOLCO|nr:hypothetical protein WOLCODRAFT_137485 [Wolfiporia cocos MD-104 SS10]